MYENKKEIFFILLERWEDIIYIVYQYIAMLRKEGPKEWINKVNILQSQLLLQDLTKSISEIAFELNYGDPSYFGRLFKKIAGVTPSEYRTAFMQDLSE